MSSRLPFVRQMAAVLLACGLIVSLLPGFAAAQDLSLERHRWNPITYPGAGHKAHPEQFPPRQGMDRGEWLVVFDVSPVNPDFMLNSIDMPGGQGVYSKDGQQFRPLNMPHHRGPTDVAFDPHDGNVAYALCGYQQWIWGPQPNSIYGIWRTDDRGATWEQIYVIPPDSFEGAVTPWGKRLIMVDPAKERGGHIYLASMHRGLVRTTDGGKNWEVLEFPDRIIRGIDAGVNKKGNTVIAAIKCSACRGFQETGDVQA